jgi:hypothetical protein
MKRKKIPFLLTLVLALGASAQDKVAQDKGAWGAVSKTAASITGDVTLGGEKITIDFATFPIAEIRTLKDAEAVALFPVEPGAAGNGNVYRVSIPAAQKFLHKNTLCGGDETEWMVSFASGRSLELAFFSGKKMPEMTAEALATTSSLCGTFTYSR